MKDSIREEIKALAIKFFPQEICGVIVSDKVIFIPNKSKSPENTFFIDLKDIESLGIKKIDGYFHSHPEGGKFSEVDIHVSEKTGITSVLYDVKNDEFSVYHPYGLEIPLEGRSFVPGMFDCISLTQDYFYRKFNLNLSEFNEIVRYEIDLEEKSTYFGEQKKFGQLLEQYFKKNGFKESEDDEYRENDLILIKYGKVKVPAHCLVYLEGGRILHHPFTGKSRIEPYSAYYQKNSLKKFRHKSL